jgi:Mor family transcriptional regulator
LRRQRAEIDAAAERIAELNRRQGMPTPGRPPAEITERPSMAEAAPELTPREDLLAKQAEVDRRRLEAGLPTGESSETPGIQPAEPTVEEPKPVPKIVDNRPLEERAAKNRLLVMRNMLKNQGGDPESLTIIPHPTAEGRFAIQSLDVPTKFTPELPRTAITRPESPAIIDPVNAYVEVQRRTNTPAARKFVQDFDAGNITRADVERAIEQEQKAAQPQPLTYTATGAPGIIAPEVSKPRGEREVPKLGEAPPKVETPPEEPPGGEPPPTTATMPQTLQEFEARMPIIMDRSEVREANNEGSFSKLTKALQLSSNPAIRRIGQLGAGIASKVTLRKPGRLGPGVAGVYRYADDSIQMIPDHAGNEHTNAHETLHALISKAQRFPTDRQKPIVVDIEKLFSHVKKELKRKGITAYGLTNVREFTAEAMTNPEFQFELMQLPYPGKKSAWTQFVKLVADLLGIQNTNALTEVMNLVDRLAQTKQPRKAVTDKGLVDETVVTPETPATAKAAPSGTPGQQALQTLSEMGMEVPKPEPGRMERTVEAIKKAKEDPKLTATSAASAFQRFADTIETWSFSSDAKLNNDYRRAVIKDLKSNEQIMGRLLEMSQSQAVHADALASQFLVDGGLKYNNDLKKWESFESKSNFAALSKKLDEIGKKYNLSKEQIERVAHTYLVSKRLPGILQRNADIEAEIAAEEATAKPDRRKINDLKDKIVFVSDKQMAQIEPGLSLAKTIPELTQVVDMWNDIRKNTIDVMVNSGLWSPEYAEMMWDNMDYVPYYREDQIENEAGPQDFIKGLQVKSKEFQLKGSEDAVNDVFDNMIRWTQYAINRSVRNSKGVQMIDNALEIQIGDKPMARKVTEQKRGMNIVRVFRDGKQELYDMADPMYMSAFAGIQNVSIPTLKFMSKVSNVLRNSVVLYPLFSVAQVPQDAFAAMFTSGLKTQHALKIPVLAVKEFIKTLMKTSQTHNTLKKFGATGVRDFSATVIRDDAEIYAGLKPPRGGWGRTKEVLQHISMAADNAVRQAVYEASMQQKLTQAEAIEKAFEIINFRRKGTSKMLNVMGQTVPFFYAYLSAQRVALKVLTGVGISPSDRKDALTTLATTSAAVATLSMLYAMANGDDEDYEETPSAIRDRTLTIPGSGGVRIPLRSDFFLFPKIIAEHTYLLMADKGYEDPAKFKKSMKDALVNAIASPTPFPTAIKPAIEVAINYDFFQGKPLIGNFEKQKDLERQFRDSTSEFAKILGSTGMISPIAADHIIRGMLGSFGGLFLFGTNQFLHSDPEVPRPELSVKEMIAAMPGTSSLLKRPQESALKNDFYELRDEVEKAVNTFNDIKNRSPEGIEEFLENEKKMARYMLGKPVDQINRELSKIRRVMTQITNMPEDQMSAAEKAENLRELRETEREILRSVNVKELRKEAKL